MRNLPSKIIGSVLIIVMLFSFVACTKTKDSGSNDVKITEAATDSTDTEKQESNKETGKTVEEKEVATIKFWTHYDATRAELLEELSQKYSDSHDDVQIEYESVPWDAYVGTKLAVAFASGTGPDIFTVSPGTIGKYVSSDIPRPLNDLLTPEIMSDFSQSSMDAVKYGDDYLALPYELELVGMFYDKDAFKEAGIDTPTTWSELKEVTGKLTTDERFGIALEVDKNPYQPFTFSPFMWIAEGNVFNEDYTASLLNSDGVKDALQLWRDLIESGSASIKPSRNTWDIGVVAEGEACIQFATVPAINTLKNTYPDKNIGVLPYPIKDNSAHYTVAGGWKLMVNKNGKYNDEAAEFVVETFAKDVDGPLKWCTEISGCYSPRQSVMEAGKDTYSNGMFKEFTDLLYGTEIPEIRMPADALEIVTEMIQRAIYDREVPVEQIADEAHKKLTEFMSSYDGMF